MGPEVLDGLEVECETFLAGARQAVLVGRTTLVVSPEVMREVRAALTAEDRRQVLASVPTVELPRNVLHLLRDLENRRWNGFYPLARRFI